MFILQNILGFDVDLRNVLWNLPVSTTFLSLWFITDDTTMTDVHNTCQNLSLLFLWKVYEYYVYSDV